MSSLWQTACPLLYGYSTTRGYCLFVVQSMTKACMHATSMHIWLYCYSFILQQSLSNLLGGAPNLSGPQRISPYSDLPNSADGWPGGPHKYTPVCRGRNGDGLWHNMGVTGSCCVARRCRNNLNWLGLQHYPGGITVSLLTLGGETVCSLWGIGWKAIE